MIVLNGVAFCDTISRMRKFLIALFIAVFSGTAIAGTGVKVNPLFNGYENQITVNFGFGVNSGFLIAPPTQFVPFNMLQIQYSQPTTFFRLPARKSVSVIQTLGHGSKYGWNWDKYTIPIAMLSEDVVPLYGQDWYTYIGLGVGMQGQQNERIGSKLLFGFKLGAGYKITECTAVELFMQHYSNGNTAPENNSYAFYGLGISYSF